MKNKPTYEETTLMSLYNPGTRLGLMEELRKMRGYLEEDEVDLRRLTDSSLKKLEEMTDAEYEELDLFPDFGA